MANMAGGLLRAAAAMLQPEASSTSPPGSRAALLRARQRCSRIPAPTCTATAAFVIGRLETELGRLRLLLRRTTHGMRNAKTPISAAIPGLKDDPPPLLLLLLPAGGASDSGSAHRHCEYSMVYTPAWLAFSRHSAPCSAAVETRGWACEFSSLAVRQQQAGQHASPPTRTGLHCTTCVVPSPIMRRPRLKFESSRQDSTLPGHGSQPTNS